MASRIVDLAEVRRDRATMVAPPASAPVAPTAVTERFHFWSGASGQRYVHTVYSLIDCPAVPAANYILVRRDASGTCFALSIGRVAEEAATLNLARIRQLGATIGATEVHIHLLAGSSRQGKLVEFDLQAGQLEGSIPGSQLRH